MKRNVLFLALALLVSSCASVDKLDQFAGPVEYPDGLFVELSNETTEFASATSGKIKVRIINRGREPITFHDHELVFGNALEVRNGAGEVLAYMPPPTPITKRQLPQYRRTLAPAEGYDVEYALSVLTEPVPDGTYTARVWPVMQVPSDTLTFRIQN